MNNELEKGNDDEVVLLDRRWEEEEILWEKEMNRIKCDRILGNLKKIMTKPCLSNLTWKNELEDIVRRIIPEKTINPWQTSIRIGTGATPRGQDLLDLIGYLENDKINIVRKGASGKYNSVINNLDIIDLLDRDFFFLGKMLEGSNIPERDDRDCNWYGTTSPYSSQTDADCICDLVTVIYNKVFYVKSIVWEMDYNDKFSKHLYFDITVYDVDV